MERCFFRKIDRYLRRYNYHLTADDVALKLCASKKLNVGITNCRRITINRRNISCIKIILKTSGNHISHSFCVSKSAYGYIQNSRAAADVAETYMFAIRVSRAKMLNVSALKMNKS